MLFFYIIRALCFSSFYGCAFIFCLTLPLLLLLCACISLYDLWNFYNPKVIRLWFSVPSWATNENNSETHAEPKRQWWNLISATGSKTFMGWCLGWCTYYRRWITFCQNLCAYELSDFNFCVVCNEMVGVWRILSFDIIWRTFIWINLNAMLVWPRENFRLQFRMHYFDYDFDYNENRSICYSNIIWNQGKCH